MQVMQRQRLLVRVGPGVYASPAAQPTIDHRRTLAILACPDAVLSHGCAARLLGFDRCAFGFQSFSSKPLSIAPCVVVGRHRS